MDTNPTVRILGAGYSNPAEDQCLSVPRRNQWRSCVTDPAENKHIAPPPGDVLCKVVFVVVHIAFSSFVYFSKGPP